MTEPLLYVGASRRIAANLIDSLILVMITVIAGVIFQAVGQADITRLWPFEVAAIALSFVYYTCMIAGPSATTVGGGVMGIKTLHTSGARLTLDRVYIRTLFHHAVFLLPPELFVSRVINAGDMTIEPTPGEAMAMAAILLGWLFFHIGIWTTREKTALHDTVMHSRVIRV